MSKKDRKKAVETEVKKLRSWQVGFNGQVVKAKANRFAIVDWMLCFYEDDLCVSVFRNWDYVEEVWT
jgi:hypothetical protein